MCACVGGVGRPGDEILGCGEIFCDGFFGEDVFVCEEGCFDVCWLGGDGEAVEGLLVISRLCILLGRRYVRYYDSFDVLAFEKFVV